MLPRENGRQGNSHTYFTNTMLKMAAAEAKRPKKFFSAKFDSPTLHSLESTILQWRNEPSTYAIVEGEGLKITPKLKLDYWLKTYMQPPANRASG